MQVDVQELLTCKWYAMPEDTIGGWCIMSTPDSPSTGIGLEVGCFLDEEIARHLAELHNEKLGL